MSGSPRSPSPLLLAGRVALLVATAAAVVTAFVATRADKGAGPRGSGAAVRYTCAMHPQVMLPGPGECPICRMTLERVRTAAVPADPRSTDAAPFRPSYDVMWARPRPAPREMRAPAYVGAGGGGSVVALFYNDEIAALEANERGTFSDSGAPGTSWAVRVAETSSTPWDEATSAVRLAVIGSGVAPAAGTAGWVKLAPRVRKSLMVPESALLQSSTGPYVLALASDRRAATKRSVDIGRTLYGFTSIVGGLPDGERIAVMDAFFLDAERRLGAAAIGADTTTPAAAP
jgi:hypothetical protein